uniref:C2H2-type domain-containing protein n=2 Tax=Onchocercidae TaxID=6296 RepID=A0A1I8EKT9_WUCBA
MNDVTAMKAITKAFRLLVDIGIQREFIIDSCVSVPQLFVSLTQKGETSIQIIELIVDFCRFTYEDSIRIFATYNEELLSAGPEEIQKCMDVLDSYGFQDEKLGEAICSCPALLFAYKSNRLAQNAENLFSHFSKNQFYSLLKSCPEILLGSTDETEDKIEYIYCHMLMEGEDFSSCSNLAQISLEELIDRHEFLLKTGIYKTPDLKRPQLKMKNPKLKKIVDSGAEQFAKKVGFVSVEEWHLFRELQNKRRVLESEGKMHPFERIKPSMRKQSERKKKSAPSNDSGTFDLYNERRTNFSHRRVFLDVWCRGDVVEDASLNHIVLTFDFLAMSFGVDTFCEVGLKDVITEYFSGKLGGELHQTYYWIALSSGTFRSCATLFSIQFESSSSSTKNYIDVCGEISECNTTAASQQRLVSGGTGSRQLKQEESIVAATSVCAVTNDTPNMSTHDEAGCMASLFHTPPWASMAILPPHNLAQQQGGVTREVVGSTNHPLAMRYSSFDGTAAAAAAKDPMNPMNAPLYQRNKTTRCNGMVLVLCIKGESAVLRKFQDLDMIASIVAKEQALLKMNTAAAASSTAEHGRLAGFAIPSRAHTQVIVNGARENMSSPSEMSPTSCSPSSSDTLQSTQGGTSTAIHAHNEHPGPEDTAPKSGNESPVDVTSLMKENEMDVGYFVVSHLNGNLGNKDLMPFISVNQLTPSASAVGSFSLAYQQHSLGPSNSSQQQQASNSRESNIQSGATTLRSRHRSSHHDGLIKCHYCPKKWADQAVLRVHMEECRLLRMHECQQCGKRFKARGGLQQHLRIHSNDRPYQCRFCPKRFTQKSHVDQHERIHTGAKPFSCQFCGRAFRQRSQQLGHESTHASGPLSMSAHLPHASSHIKFENANQQQQTQGMAMSQSTQQTIADAIGARNSALG